MNRTLRALYVFVGLCIYVAYLYYSTTTFVLPLYEGGLWTAAMLMGTIVLVIVGGAVDVVFATVRRQR